MPLSAVDRFFALLEALTPAEARAQLSDRATDSDPQAIAQRALIAVAAGAPEQAREAGEHALSAAPTEPVCRYAAGMAAAINGDWKAVVADLEPLGPKFPRYVEARIFLATALLRLGRPAEARAALANLSAEDDASHAMLHAIRGRCAIELGSPAGGVLELRSALALSPDIEWIHPLLSTHARADADRSPSSASVRVIRV